MNKLGQEPVFPTTDKTNYYGMSKRFYAACCAMQGLLLNSATTYPWKTLCNMSYELADELLKQENE